MTNPALIASQSSQVQRPVRYRGAIWTLMVLSPVIAEVLSGSTRLSIIFVLVPEILCWGAGALLARELVRRWRGGVPSLLVLGLALSIAEEFLIQQTSLAPLPFPGANAAYSRFFGVNWVYFLFMLLYESVWVVLVPVEITELLFPERRHQPWLRTRGLIVTSIGFLIGCRVAWYGWTQQALPRMGVPPYHPPRATFAAGLAAIVALFGIAYALRGYGRREGGEAGAARSPLTVWLAGILSLVAGSGWWALMVLIFSPRPVVSAGVAIAAGLCWAVFAFIALSRLSASPTWNDRHRWAAAAGATLSCMAPGYLSLAGWTRPDLVFKIITNILAVAALALLARKVWTRNAGTA